MLHTKSNSTSLSEDATSHVSSAGTTKVVHDFASLNPLVSSVSPPPHQKHQQNKIKKKRSLPGNPDPDAEVIALSPKTLLATNRYVCEFCNKGFQRDQNLQLHRRGHNLPWKLKQRSAEDMKKKAYVCPESSCVHHNPSRALGDLTGIKKHYCRKHGEKKWKCHKCSKVYAVQSDWKAHSKTCGTREYRCDCGTLFSRKGSFITHRAFCDALAEESARLSATITNPNYLHFQPLDHIFPNTFTPQNDFSNPIDLTASSLDPPPNPNPNTTTPNPVQIKPEPSRDHHRTNQNRCMSPLVQHAQPHNGLIVNSPFPNLHMTTQPHQPQSVYATLDLDQLTPDNNVGRMCFATGEVVSHASPEFFGMSTWQKSDHRLTRDFLGLTDDNHSTNGNAYRHGGSVDVSVNVSNVLNFTGGVEFQQYEHDRSLLLNLKPRGRLHYGFAESPSSGTWGD